MRYLRPCLLLLALAGTPGCVAVADVGPSYGYAYRSPPPVPYYGPRSYAPRRHYAPRRYHAPPAYRYGYRPGRPYYR